MLFIFFFTEFTVLFFTKMHQAMSWCRLRYLKRAFATSSAVSTSKSSGCPRVNEINIQLLSESLHKQVMLNNDIMYFIIQCL